jgi:Ca2+-binding EF-hand superfamily protein
MQKHSDTPTPEGSITPGTKGTATSWAGRAFKALDSDNRGFLFKHELLDHIKKGGVYSHHQLQTLINALECKAPKDPIDFQEFEYLLHGQNFIKRVLENHLSIP